MKAIVLLSGGLDSAVSLLLAASVHQVELALTFDYGQRAAANEIRAAQLIAESSGILHQVIPLSFMNDIGGELTGAGSQPINNPWVPNRNGIFINIAAAYAESRQAGLLICGFNREEAVNFPDNSADYVDSINQALAYSTCNQVQVKSWTQEMDKVEIIRTGLSLGLDFNDLWSCYQDGVRPCGQCSSCITNRQAFKKAGIYEYANFMAGSNSEL